MCERDELGKIREKVRVVAVEVEEKRVEETGVYVHYNVVRLLKEDEKRKCNNFSGFFTEKKTEKDLGLLL